MEIVVFAIALVLLVFVVKFYTEITDLKKQFVSVNKAAAASKREVNIITESILELSNTLLFEINRLTKLFESAHYKEDRLELLKSRQALIKAYSSCVATLENYHVGHFEVKHFETIKYSYVVKRLGEFPVELSMLGIEDDTVVVDIKE